MLKSFKLSGLLCSVIHSPEEIEFENAENVPWA